MNSMYKDKDVYWFIKENNELDGIMREPTSEEMAEFTRFMGLKTITLDNMIRLVKTFSPKAQLRDDYSFDIQDGPWGGPHIKTSLQKILSSSITSPWRLYMEYEKIKPFTQGNGVSGRALWAWKAQDISEGFLVKFYTQTLNAFRNNFITEESV
jgi:hypothetical protein